jgi:hypothetical protein
LKKRREKKIGGARRETKIGLYARKTKQQLRRREELSVESTDF